MFIHPNTGQDLEDHRDRAVWIGKSVPLVLDIFTEERRTDRMDSLLPLAKKVGEKLKARKETVGVSESSAGGLISAVLLAVPGASAYFMGGAVVYTRPAGEAFLTATPAKRAGIRSSSEPWATLAAELVRERLNTYCSSSTRSVTSPAIRRGSRIPVREGLEEVPALQGGQALLDRALRRLWLPAADGADRHPQRHPPRRGAASTTVVQIALAVGTLLAVLALINSVTTTTNDGLEPGPLRRRAPNTAVGTQFDASAVRLIRTTPGVAQAQPMPDEQRQVQGQGRAGHGFPQRPLFETPISQRTHGTRPPRRRLARTRRRDRRRTSPASTGTHVGDRVTLQTGAGPASFRVIGMTSSQWNNGHSFYVPLQTVQQRPAHDTVNGYFVRTTSRDHARDRPDDDTARGPARRRRLRRRHDGQVLAASRPTSARTGRSRSAIGVLGLLIVAISMVGLVNAITMSVLERTREIGVLRCIGARARDIRRIFTAEGLTVSLAGWLLGIPVGYALARMFSWLMLKVVGIEFGFTFPPLNLLIALVGTVAARAA